MLNFKTLVILLVLALAAACGEQKATSQPAGQVADNEENRLAAAKKYLEVAPPQDLLNEMRAEVEGKLPEPAQKTFKAVMDSQALKDNTSQLALKALVKHFTVKELQAMTAFNSTPEGKAVRGKHNAYMTEVMGGINMEVLKAFQEVTKAQQGQEQPPAASGAPQPQGPAAAPPGPQTPGKPGEPKAPEAVKMPPPAPPAPAAKPAPPAK